MLNRVSDQPYGNLSNGSRNDVQSILQRNGLGPGTRQERHRLRTAKWVEMIGMNYPAASHGVSGRLHANLRCKQRGIRP